MMKKVKDYWKTGYENYMVKLVGDAGLEGENKKLNTMPRDLATFVLSNSNRKMNYFIHTTNGFYTNDVYYTDTDSL